MRSVRQRLAAVTMVAGLTTLGVGLLAGPAGAVTVDECSSHLSEGQNGALAITSDVAGHDVPAGTDVDLKATWDQTEWLEKANVFVCVTTNGVWNPSLSAVQAVVASDGTDDRPYPIPADLPVGTNVCVREVLSGRLSDRTQGSQTSNEVCFRSAAAPNTTMSTTTAPTTTTTPNTTAADLPTAGVNPPPPVVAVAPEVASTPAPAPASQLPRTGSQIDVLATIGALAISLGGLARLIGRHERPSSPSSRPR